MIRRRQSESACFICQSPVPLLQDECCSFRLPLPGENTLLVANHTGQPCRHKRDQQEAWLRCGRILLLEANWACCCFYTLHSHKVSKVPDEFPDDVLLPLLVEHAVVALQDNILVLLSKHHRWILDSEKTASYPQYLTSLGKYAMQGYQNLAGNKQSKHNKHYDAYVYESSHCEALALRRLHIHSGW